LSETSLTYSGQFFDFCVANGAEAWAISENSRRELFEDGPIRVENRSKRMLGRGSLRFHLRQLLHALSLIGSCLRYRPDIMIVDSGTTHWFLLAPVRLIGTRIVVNFHTGYWPVTNPPRGLVKRLIAWLDGRFFRHCVSAFIGVSPETQKQAERLAGKPLPFFQHRAQFHDRDFRSLPAPDLGDRPFRIVFAGRMEDNKGVFDLLEMAERLAERRPGEVLFEVCGSGSALDAVVAEHERRRLEETMVIYGSKERTELLEIYARSHLMIVPTKSTFSEGLPKACAEAALCRRPVISSALANADDVLDGALILAQPDDVESYCDAIERLLDNPEEYALAQSKSEAVRGQFLDRSQGMTAALNGMLNAIRPTRHY